MLVVKPQMQGIFSSETKKMKKNKLLTGTYNKMAIKVIKPTAETTTTPSLTVVEPQNLLHYCGKSMVAAVLSSPLPCSFQIWIIVLGFLGPCLS